MGTTVLTAPPMARESAECQIAALHATLGRMEHALGVLDEAIAWTDECGNILWCNAAFARLAMRPVLAIVGKPVEQILALSRQGRAIEKTEHPVRRILSAAGPPRPSVEAFETERGGQARYLEIHTACLRSATAVSAMMVIRDQTERYLAERWLDCESRRAELVRAVAAASNEAEDAEVALEAGLQLICRFLEWPLGRAVLTRPRPGSPNGQATGLWAGDKLGEFEEFTGAIGGAEIKLDGLPASTLEWSKPVWLGEAAARSRYGNAWPARLGAALVFPVRSLRETEAVIELFSTSASEPDAKLMPVLEQIGGQLARVFERQQSQLSLVRANEDLERRVAERTKELMALNSSLEVEIASRERFQAALREAMDRYHSLMQSVRDVIFGVSRQGRVQSLNSAFDSLTGLNWKDQVMERVIRLIHKEDRKTAARAFRQTLAGQQVTPFEIRIRHVTGEWIFVECSLTLQAKAGHQPSVAGIARDATESRRSKVELMVRDRAMAASSEGIVITDAREPGNPITFVNSGFERLTGYAAAMAIGQNLKRLLRGPDTSQETIRRIEQAVEECRPETVEMKAHRQDGEPFWVRLVVTPVRDDFDRPANFVAILSDISPQKEAERMKNEFVSTVSHELRTPLTSLRGFAELILERDYPPEKQRKFVQIIHRESTRLGNLINDFLDVQRMESGHQDYRLAKVPLPQILNDTAALFRPTSPIHQFEVNCEATLPHVKADVDRLRQITTNLLSNAVKFSPKGGLVELRARSQDNMVEVSIADQGIGIPADAIGRLFEKFYRVDNTETRKIGGTGLGLSIVKQIVDAHGGRIWVESTPGQGTRILFTLPMFA